MHQLGKQFFHLLLIIGFVAFLAGCGQAPEVYDSLRGDVLADLAQALEEDDGAKIARSLERLEGLLSEPEFVFRLRANEEQRHVLADLNRVLGEGDLSRAAAIVERHRTRIAAPAEWLALPRQVEALAVLDAYLAGRPHADAQAMATALRAVQGHARHVSSSPVFTAWLQGELDSLADLRQRERRERVAELLADCDRAVARQAFDSELTFARLHDFAPQSAFVAMHRELRAGQTEGLSRLLQDADASIDPLQLKGAEIFLMATRQSMDAEIWLPVARRVAALPPQSLSGHLLRVYVAVAEDRRGRALLWSRRYLEAGGVATAKQVDEIVSSVVLPAAQFNARVWRVPFPSVDEILGRLVQWHDFHAREGAPK